ncbi:cytochrome c [Sediminibacterium sp.]|uniref:c-type cytochrome n=1 Tax=Sediminibacterium sp. TaxID=1917865 RepID=UPI0027375A76|nr:cytochrome c [Sediminibacterium sp.]MDP3393626.1 cytochrome c [Sediminibacterium sp.]MDP3566601.1 cytochrome c [Sediminibacterium sp.]
MRIKLAIFGLGLILLSNFSNAQTSVQGKSKQMLNGKKVYDMYCQACHQADGNGVPRLNPPLAGTVYVTGSKTRLIDIVLNGLTDPIEINGEEYNNPMAAHSFLTDQQIADVLTYIRNSFGNKAGAVSVAEVKKQRAKK